MSARARDLLSRILARRQKAKERLGSDDPAMLMERLREQKVSNTTDGRDTETLAANGLRLFPLDRLIRSIEDLEFNQFPQILAYWRSRNGPLAARKDAAGRALQELEMRLGLIR